MSADPAFVDEDASSGSGEDVNMLDGHNKRQSATPNSGHRKRSRKAIGDAIVDAMLEIAAASKMRAAAIIKNEERFSISKCIKVLDEMQGVDQSLYFFALDLFENPSAREIFISLKSERQLTWLQGKFSASSNTSRSMEDVDLELDEMELVAAAAGYYYYNSITNQPLRSISPSGSGFMTELLSERNDWLFAGIGGGTIEDLPDLEDSHELQLASSVQEQIASSFRDSVAAAMWDDFINNRDEW
ncbi:hypothetical protein RJ639_025317 [Escallonia herrerae]|uniref:Uncharacterized protein n=1 Tax=Escallonia herrerae TaxID=1293975 RepID=A0AA88S331_9ASTE|nr:hypothetical protein RJ639_025317 [Escallonia herrerae]